MTYTLASTIVTRASSGGDGLISYKSIALVCSAGVSAQLSILPDESKRERDKQKEVSFVLARVKWPLVPQRLQVL